MTGPEVVAYCAHCDRLHTVWPNNDGFLATKVLATVHGSDVRFYHECSEPGDLAILRHAVYWAWQ